jgi:hydrogenase nickel incorporation protein HypB
MCIDCGCPQPHHHDPEHPDIPGQGRHEHSHAHGDSPTHTHTHIHEHRQERRTVRVEENLLAKNDHLAAGNRETFRSHGLFVLNLVSSPGSGKTSLLERTLRDLSGAMRFAVLEGDQQTANDAMRIAATGVPVKQINTGAGCHLDAHMVGHGVEVFVLAATDVLMIENVGNLVCPASFDLGEDHKVAVLSVTEGEDKPLKYPHMFRAADLLLINKIDLLPYLRFDLEKCRDFARQVHPEVKILEVSALTGQGMDEWYGWLKDGVSKKRDK